MRFGGIVAPFGNIIENGMFAIGPGLTRLSLTRLSSAFRAAAAEVSSENGKDARVATPGPGRHPHLKVGIALIPWCIPRSTGGDAIWVTCRSIAFARACWFGFAIGADQLTEGASSIDGTALTRSSDSQPRPPDERLAVHRISATAGERGTDPDRPVRRALGELLGRRAPCANAAKSPSQWPTTTPPAVPSPRGRRSSCRAGRRAGPGSGA